MATKRQAMVRAALAELAPMMPLEDANAVKMLAGRPHMRRLPISQALWLATVSHIRHSYTDYDSLMNDGYDRESARFFVADDINAVLRCWQATRMLDPETESAMADAADR